MSGDAERVVPLLRTSLSSTDSEVSAEVKHWLPVSDLVAHLCEGEHAMSEVVMGAVFAFGWGLAVASGLLAGAVLALVTRVTHRVMAAVMSLGAGVLLSIASIKIGSEAIPLAGAASTVAGVIAGAALFSIANATLAAAKDRKRCGECKPQPSETESPNSGTAIALGTALDAI